jgi:hypothetical protein
MRITIEEILRGRSVGRMQSVSQMQVIPILGESDDAFGPPEIAIGTTTYGRVEVDNREARTTIVPPGAAWVVARKAQDHAVGPGAIVPGLSQRSIPAMCVQQNQPGLIPMDRYELQILPAGLRAKAIALRDQDEFSRLWPHLSELKTQYGLPSGYGNLIDFMRAFARELDEFVAEFEVVPDQVGAIVLVGGAVAGLELAPSTAYFEAVWVPLIRLCYGSLALPAQRMRGATPPATRTALLVRDRSIAGIARALDEAEEADRSVVAAVIRSLAPRELKGQRGGDSSVGATKMRVVKGEHLIGQIAHTAVPVPAVKFASIVATA